MVELAHAFRPTTRTSRRPTPIDFVHRRSWVDPESRWLKLNKQELIENVQKQYDENVTFYVSNIIQRAITKLEGHDGIEFVPIGATSDGSLKVALTAIHPVSESILRAKIDFSGAGDNTIIAAVALNKIHVLNIIFTVGGETNITFKSGTTAITGAMDFGGSGEPHGMVGTLGASPIITALGEAFVINSSAAVQVSGIVVYSLEEIT